jgi:hypothetical protein
VSESGQVQNGAASSLPCAGRPWKKVWIQLEARILELEIGRGPANFVHVFRYPFCK